MPTVLSHEGRISAILRELDCSARQFVGICKEKGIAVSTFTLSQAMTGIKPLDHRTGQKLLEVAQLMRSTRDYLAFVPLDWSQSEKIALLLSLICLRLVAAEAHDDQTLDAADSALAAEFQRGHMAYTKARRSN